LGRDVQMTLVNFHSGVKPEDDPSGLNRENRGSAGCPTCSPKDADAFFENFDFSNGTTGNAEGTVTIFRGESDKSKEVLGGLLKQQQNQNSTTTPPPIDNSLKGAPKDEKQ